MKRDLRAFHDLILGADWHSCMDPRCACKGRGFNRLDPHHIRSRSLGGADSLENGISLCDVAHDKAEWGYRDKATGKRVTAAQYMIRVLEHWEDKPHFRWKEALQWLKDRDQRKGTCK